MAERMRVGAARRRALAALALVAAATLPGCTGDSGATSSSPSGRLVVRIASFDFPESVLLADLYGNALRAAGYAVTVRPNLGSREIVFPALEQGYVDLVPEYLGSALGFAGLGKVPPTSDQGANHSALTDLLRPRGLSVLDSAPAQNQNAVVVTAATASRLGLRTTSDLRSVAGSLTIGGPPECARRPLCLPGLQKTYGLTFERFEPLDSAGSYTLSALVAGRIDVGILFSTDGRIGDGLIVLSDNKGLQPAENVTPLVRSATASMLGGEFVDVIDEVSSLLTTDELRALNAQASGDDSQTVAAQWLKEHGIGH